MKKRLASRAHKAPLRFASLPADENARLRMAEAVVSTLGEDLCAGVPGLYRRADGRWSICGPPGIMAPGYDAEGRIVALKVLPDDGGPEVWLSSEEHGGPAPPIHKVVFNGFEYLQALGKVWIDG